jgi:CRISPR-associated protein Csc1
VAQPISLADAGVRLWRGQLVNHDFLWFATTDVNATAATWPILHNYALTYAVCQFSYAAYKGYKPRYFEDFERKVSGEDWATEQGEGVDRMPAYALPSTNPAAGRERLTHNALDDKTLLTSVGRTNTPKLGRRICLTPAVSASGGFPLLLFTWDDFRPPGVFRLGKKGCPIRAQWQEVAEAAATIPPGEFSPCHPVNPLDLQQERSVVSYYPALLPPHLLYVECRLRNEWAVPVRELGWVHLPARVARRLSLSSPASQ